MTDQHDTRVPPNASGNAGCNMIALLILLIVVAIFVIAAWISMPNDSPAPIDTGIPPTAPQ